MILQIPPGLLKKVLPEGRSIPVIHGRPYPRKIDLNKVQFFEVPTKDTGKAIPWHILVAFMKKLLRNGLLPLGTREFCAIYCDKNVDPWLHTQPADNPWKMGNGGLIGFPNGLIKIGKREPIYDVALWHPKNGWHVRQFGPDEPGQKQEWHSYLRLPVLPLND